MKGEARLMEVFPPAKRRAMRKALTRWYAAHGRALPWRQSADPYRIWISEIMLQQTTVKAVIPYYERFLARFPTVQELASASESEVLQCWEGLGYYSRGRNLRLAAQYICERCRGEFPSDLAALQALPGIGRYTAGAIRSFAFDLPAPIVEANTLRVYCRLLGYDGDPRSNFGQELLWSFAEMLQPPRNAGHVNQALMELGGTLCTSVRPRCDTCPVSSHCIAFAAGRTAEIPIKRPRPEVTHVVEATVAIRRGKRFLVRQRTPEERWAGMWDFPRFPIESLLPREKLTSQPLSRLLAESACHVCRITGIPIAEPVIANELHHSVTRYRIRLICLVAEELNVQSPESISKRKSQRAGGIGPLMKWATLKELSQLPMPVTGRKFAQLLMRNSVPEAVP